MADYDWEAIRTTFVQGLVSEDGTIFPSLRETADYHETPYSAVRRRAADEHWNERRVAYKAQVEKITAERRAEALSKELVEFDSRTLAAAKAGVMLTSARLQQIAARFRAQEERAAREGGDLLVPAIEASELRTLGAALQTFHETGRVALGVESSTMRHEVAAATERPAVRRDIDEELNIGDIDRVGRLIGALDRAGVVAFRGRAAGDPPSLDAKAPDT